jgi:hypothetical protein
MAVHRTSSAKENEFAAKSGSASAVAACSRNAHHFVLYLFFSVMPEKCS